jgi:hypothetical protein
MQKKRLLILFIIGIVVATLAGSTLALAGPPQPETSSPMEIMGTSASYQLIWDVNADGGTTMSSSSYTMMSTIGQPVAGEMANSNYTLQNGFWYGVFRMFKVFLPLIVKG